MNAELRAEIERAIALKQVGHASCDRQLKACLDEIDRLTRELSSARLALLESKRPF